MRGCGLRAPLLAVEIHAVEANAVEIEDRALGGRMSAAARFHGGRDWIATLLADADSQGKDTDR